MANVMFNPAREGFLTGLINWSVAEQRVALVRGYTPDADHTWLSDITGAGGTIVTSVTLTGKTTTNGSAGANDLTLVGVAAGAAIPGLLIYQHSLVDGSPASGNNQRRVICYYDQGANLPITPTGDDIEITWDPTNKIFQV